MLYQCLRKSITSELQAKVSVDQTRYYLTIPGPTPQDPVTKCRDGICFLKAIIDETYTNTLNNAAVTRSNLATLGQYMKKLDDSNILELRRNPGNKTPRSDSRSKKQDKDWKAKPPREGEPKTKSVTIQSKVYVYHWCPHHRKWTIHPPKDCLLKKKEAEGKKEKATANTDGTPTLKAMTAAFQEAILGESGLDTPFPS